MKKIAVVVFLCVLFPICIELSAGDVRWEPRAITVTLARENDPLSPEQFIQAALVYSGVTEADLPAYRGKIQSILSETERMYGQKTPDETLADELLGFLHRSYLTRYRETATELDTLLDKGIYNCVSSSVLYVMVAEPLGFSATPVRTRDHALIKITVGGRSFDVETTSQYGFDPGKKKDFSDEFGRVTGFVYTPPSNYSDRIDIGKKELLSLILQNRIALFMKEKKYDRALEEGVDLFELLKEKDALAILIGIVTEFSRHALATGKFETGAAIIDQAVRRYRDFEQFAEIRRIFIHDWVQKLITGNSFSAARTVAHEAYASGKISADDFRKLMLFCAYQEAERAAADRSRGPEEALRILEQARRELGDDESLSRAEETYAYNYILDMAGKGDLENAFQTLKRFRSDKILSEERYRVLFVFATLKKAEKTAREKNFLEGVLLIEEGIMRLGKDPKLVDGAAVYSHNYVISLLETGDFAGAKAYLESPRAAAYHQAAERKELFRYYYMAKADDARQKRGPREAIDVLEEGINDLGTDQVLLKKYEATVHNYIVVLVEQRDLARAEQIVRRALTLDPGSARFQKDLEAILNSR